MCLSYYYQLYEQPGLLDVIAHDPRPFLGLDLTNVPLLYVINTVWVKFVLSWFYTPEVFGIDQDTANLCNSPFARMEFLSVGFFWCYNGTGSLIIDSWNSWLDTPEVQATLGSVGLDNTTIAGFNASIASCTLVMPFCSGTVAINQWRSS